MTIRHTFMKIQHVRDKYSVWLSYLKKKKEA